MSAGGETAPPAAPHIPVLLDEVMEALAPIAGGIFIVYTSMKEILHMMGLEELDHEERKPKSLAALA